jgi:hypothetical protein
VHASKGGRVAVFLETKIWISDYGYDETLHTRCPHRSPSRTPPPGFTSTDGTASAASFTSTGTPLNLHG